MQNITNTGSGIAGRKDFFKNSDELNFRNL